MMIASKHFKLLVTWESIWNRNELCGKHHRSCGKV